MQDNGPYTRNLLLVPHHRLQYRGHEPRQRSGPRIGRIERNQDTLQKPRPVKPRLSGRGFLVEAIRTIHVLFQINRVRIIDRRSSGRDQCPVWIPHHTSAPRAHSSRSDKDQCPLLLHALPTLARSFLVLSKNSPCNLSEAQDKPFQTIVGL